MCLNFQMSKQFLKPKHTAKTKCFYKRSLKMLKAFLFIFMFLGLGELIVYVMGIVIPGNILGMLLIFLALRFKLIKLETVKPASDVLVNNMMLFFVPFAVGLLSYFDFIKEYWIILSVVASVSTLITLFITGFVQQKLENND